MTTLLDKTGLPLWACIVLICVGSILVLATVGVLSRCWFVRRRAARRGEFDNLTGATRRVTLRRGRMVPTSQHLSLTGSKFGVRQFGVLADNESTMTGRRSPFEWWNTMVERSQSRQDQMSQMETGSIISRPASRDASLAGRRDSLFATPTPPPQIKEPVTRTSEMTQLSPSPTSSFSSQKTINFSRAFVRTPTSPLSQRPQNTLSRISERSLHYSMISMNMPDRLSGSYQAAINPSDNTPLPGQAQPNPRRSMTLAVPSSRSPVIQRTPSSPTPQLNRDANRLSASAALTASMTQAPSLKNPPRPHTADAASSRHFVSQGYIDPVPSLPLPKPVIYVNSILPRTNGATVNPLYGQSNQPQMDLSRPSSTRSFRDSGAPPPPPKTSHTSVDPSGINYDTQLPNYWSTTFNLMDVGSSLDTSGNTSRGDNVDPLDNDGEGHTQSVMGILTVPGKKNSKVLRKKSLRRARPSTAA